MRKGLFRKQVAQHQRPKLHGEILMAPQPVFTLITCLLVAWVTSVVAYLATSSYARKATVTGWLEPDLGVIRLYSPLPHGKISQLFVSEGDSVEKGDPLVELDFTTPSNSHSSVESELRNELIKTKQRLTQTLERTRLIQQTEQAQYLHEQQAAQKDLTSLVEIEHLAQQQWVLASDAHLAQRRLHVEGNISKLELDAAALQDLSAKQRFREAKRNAELKRALIQEINQTLLTLPETHANQRVQLENQLSEIDKQLLHLDKSGTRIIYATSSSVVSTIQANEGHTVDVTKPLMNLLPQNANLEARLLVPVSAAGFLNKGQQISIRYDAFPYQKFGLHQGRIESVSQSLILPGDWVAAPIHVNEPTYLVKANLDEKVIYAYGNNVALKTGMTFSADIVLGERTIFEWLLEPILSTTGRL